MKTIITLIIPAIGASYDVLVPGFMKIADLTPLLSSAVQELSGDNYVSSGNELLCHKETNQLLIQECSLDDYKVQNGDHILII